ncbi:MAG: glycosyltransferase family 2 protein [Sideroxydans sp.]|nr:glycosyltransferase family 2 protein [Sideroxydans sp.]
MRGNFTVVTPNFNMGSYLEETIQSVLLNLKPGDEYFIVDGGSTDESLEVIRRYEDKITGWVSENDHGYADAISKGLAKATSEYLCWINCGDLLLAGALELARDKLNSLNAEMIFGDDLYFDDKGVVVRTTNGHADNLANLMLYGGWTPLQDACFWKRTLYERIGGIDSTLKYAADYDLFLRMSLHGKCQYVSAIFSAFRQHEGQTSIKHVKGYKRERMLCRYREINIHSDSTWKKLVLNTYYWWKVRWRVRMQGANRRMSHLAGHQAKTVPCQISR